MLMRRPGSQRCYCGRQPVERLALLVPAGHEPDLAGAPFIEVEALGAQAIGLTLVHSKEDLVRFDRIDETMWRGSRQFLRSGIRVTRVLKPQIALEHRQDLGCQKTSL